MAKVRDFPELVKEIHPTLNDDIQKILNLSIGSHIKVFWYCPKKCAQGCEHVYEMEIRQKVKSINKCSFCDGKSFCEHTSLGGLYPELIDCWHPVRNGDIEITDVSPGSHYMAWWICYDAECGCVHEYKQIVYLKISAYKNYKDGKTNSHCVYCNGSMCDYHKSIKYLRPDLMEEWDYELNKKIDPETMPLGSNTIIHWICKKGCQYKECEPINEKVDINKCKHRWKTAMLSRGLTNSKCPYCLIAPQSICYHQSIEFTHPELAKEWHPTLNKDLQPHQVSNKSNKRVHWKCQIGCIHKEKNEDERCHHVWSTTIASRFHNNKMTMCPFCVSSPQKICNHQSLGYLFPEYIDEWDNEKNELTIFDITPSSQRIIHWICRNKHENGDYHRFTYSSYDRSKQNKNCPYCRNKTINVLHDFLIQHFDIKMEKRFDWCRSVITNRLLPFDVYIEDLQLCIELDGDHHFQDIKGWNSSSDKRRYVDIYKMKLANEHDISILRIVQIDIYYNSYDWKSKLLEMINQFTKGTPENKYICIRNEYDIYHTEYDSFEMNDFIDYMKSISDVEKDDE